MTQLRSKPHVVPIAHSYELLPQASPAFLRVAQVDVAESQKAVAAHSRTRIVQVAPTGFRRTQAVPSQRKPWPTSQRNPRPGVTEDDDGSNGTSPPIVPTHGVSFSAPAMRTWQMLPPAVPVENAQTTLPSADGAQSEFAVQA